MGRDALYAEIQGVQIGCTHLSTSLDLPYYGNHSSYEGQQRYELNTLLEFMNNQNNGQPQVILGDFNTGPDVLPYIKAFAGENYPLMVE